MAKDKVSKLDFNEDGKITFYASQKKYTFSLPVLDENGKPIYDTDGHGNNRTIRTKRYSFEYLPVLDPDTNKIKPNDPWCFFTVNKDDPDADRLLKYLEDASSPQKSKITKVMNEATYQEKKNPEAYKANLEKKALHDEVESLKKEIEALKSKK